MNTVKLLLFATVALLIAAFAWSWYSMKDGVKATPDAEVRRLSKQNQEIKEELERLRIERAYRDLRNQPVAVTPPPAPPQQPQVPAAEVRELQSQLDAAEAEKQKAQRNAKTFEEEANLANQRALETNDRDLRRARVISEALLVGRVESYVEDPQVGDFVTVEILSAENIKVGSVLAIRRKSGILGQLKVSEVEGSGAIASAMAGFGEIKPKAGDELILPPLY